MKKLFGVAMFFSVVIVAVTVCYYFSCSESNSQDVQAEQIIAVNELEQLSRMGKSAEVAKKAAQLQESIRKSDNDNQGDRQIVIMCGICLLFQIVVIGYVYFAILRPFDKMKVFAEKIAQGNFDIPLDYERSNYFGKFTWAFDNMRREITKARCCEREAIENNKTVIATLSHDIKTPISSIRAYAEGLEANLDETLEKRMKYLSVIMRKCDEVSKLTNDLFLHSLSDLEKLRINKEEFELCDFISKALKEMAVEQDDIRFERMDGEVFVDADKNRMVQIVENLINNARKYAKSEINVSIVCVEDMVEIHFRDYGEGIPNEDMPFIFDKFYRGRNCGNEQGSGLGLYIVKYVMGQMAGEVLLQNYMDGLEVIISLPVKRREM